MSNNIDAKDANSPKWGLGNRQRGNRDHAAAVEFAKRYPVPSLLSGNELREVGRELFGQMGLGPRGEVQYHDFASHYAYRLTNIGTNVFLMGSRNTFVVKLEPDGWDYEVVKPGVAIARFNQIRLLERKSGSLERRVLSFFQGVDPADLPPHLVRWYNRLIVSWERHEKLISHVEEDHALFLQEGLLMIEEYEEGLQDNE